MVNAVTSHWDDGDESDLTETADITPKSSPRLGRKSRNLRFRQPDQQKSATTQGLAASQALDLLSKHCFLTNDMLAKFW